MTPEMWRRSDRSTTGGAQRVRRTVVAGGTAVVLGTAALAAGSASPAAADHEFDMPPVLHSPNWIVCAAGVGGGLPAQSVSHAIAVWDPAPDVTVTAGCPNMNVFVQATAYAEEWWGRNDCWVWRSDGDCDGVVISLNSRILDSVPNRAFEWKQTACHEMGHTAALGHRDTELTTCMASGTASINPDAHDLAAIDATYPR